jgi:hypothetical protein
VVKNGAFLFLKVLEKEEMRFQLGTVVFDIISAVNTAEWNMGWCCANISRLELHSSARRLCGSASGLRQRHISTSVTFLTPTTKPLEMAGIRFL